MHESKAHNRKSIRLKEYDYSQEGYYFITICTHKRQCILAKINYKNVGAGPVSVRKMKKGEKDVRSKKRH